MMDKDEGSILTLVGKCWMELLFWIKLYYLFHSNNKFVSNKIIILATTGYDKYSYQANRVEFNWPDPDGQDTPLDGREEYLNENMTITLPHWVDANDIEWLSVWCDDFKISFGDLVFNSDKKRQNACPRNEKK